VLTTSPGLAAALPVYFWLFEGSISLPAFLAILVVEAVLWRIIDVIVLAQNGLGRFTTGALVVTAASAIRAGGAVAFVLMGGGDVERWSLYYFASNLVALLVVFLVFRPPVRPRWRSRLFVSRFRDGAMFALSYFALNAQGQIDKLIVLSLADARFAGIYAISSRIVDFTALAVAAGRQRGGGGAPVPADAAGAGLPQPDGISWRAVLRLWPHDGARRRGGGPGDAERRRAGAAAVHHCRQLHHRPVAQRRLWRALSALRRRALPLRHRWCADMSTLIDRERDAGGRGRAFELAAQRKGCDPVRVQARHGRP